MKWNAFVTLCHTVRTQQVPMSISPIPAKEEKKHHEIKNEPTQSSLLREVLYVKDKRCVQWIRCTTQRQVDWMKSSQGRTKAAKRAGSQGINWFVQMFRAEFWRSGGNNHSLFSPCAPPTALCWSINCNTKLWWFGVRSQRHKYIFWIKCVG